MNDQRIYHHSIKEFHIKEINIIIYYPIQLFENHSRNIILQVEEYRDPIHDMRSYYSYIEKDRSIKRDIQIEYSSLLSQ
jgi:hypothetical protein